MSYSDEMRLLGLNALRPIAVITGFQACGACATIVCAKISERHLVDSISNRGKIGLFDMFVEAKALGNPPADGQEPEKDSQGPTTPVDLDGNEKMTRPFITEVVNNTLKEIIGESGASIELVGLDSLTVVEVSNKLSDLMGVALPATLLYDYPTIQALVDYLDRQFGSKRISMIEETVAIASQISTEQNLLVSSLYARLPQTVNNDAVTCGPEHRCAFSFDQGVAIPFGSWLDSVEYFDNTALSMSPNEARVLDPQHRAMLELVFEACSEKNFKEASKIKTSVYVGMQHAEYIHLYALHNREINAFSATSSAFSVAAGRISYTFSLKGPAMSVDTACSSALCAAHLGRQDILNARSTGAISSTVNMMLSIDTTRSTNVSGMLSKDGRCKTFDSSADGYVRAEGVAVVAMEPFKILENQTTCSFGDKFLMVSSFVNQDGRTNTLTAPNGPSQQRVILGALTAGTVSHSSIKALQLHGTGTALGDPIEMGALQNVFKENMPDKTAFASKSIHGHLEPASGFVGLYHATIQLKFEQASPVQHLKTLNRYLFNEKSSHGWLPKIQRESAILPASTPDRVYQGVSAFAFQGTNAHIIISKFEEYSTKSVYVLQWRRSRFWYAVANNRLLSACAVNRGDSVTFTCALTAKFSYVLDHIVREKIIFPAAAMLMASFAAIDAKSNNSNFSFLLSNLAIHRAMTLRANASYHLLDIVVRQNQVLLYEKEAHISESTVALCREQNKLSNKKMSMKDRLYAQFINGAQRALGTMLIPSLSDYQTLRPMGCIEKSMITEEICPNIIDAATHVLAGAMERHGSLYLPTMIESAKYQFQNGMLDNNLSCCSQSAYSKQEISSDLKLVGQTSAYLLMSNFVVKSLEHTDSLPNKSKSITPSRTIDEIDQGRLGIEIIISTTVKNILGAEVPKNLPLFEAGVDSLVSLDIVEQINAYFGLNLPSTLLYDAPTIDAIAALITETLPTTDFTPSQDATDITTNSLASPAPEINKKSEIAIIDCSFRYPGDGTDFSEGDPFILNNEGCSIIPHQVSTIQC